MAASPNGAANPLAASIENRDEVPSTSVLRDRETFVGGSEAFELLNEKSYGRGCARALGYRKKQVEPDFQPERDDRRAMSLRAFMKRGQLLEDIAAEIYMEITKRKLIRRDRLVRNPDHPGAGVHTDRIILGHCVDGDPNNILSTGDAEIKTHGEGPFFNILRNGLPPGHNLQLQWSLFCTGHTWGSFIILGVFGGDERTGLPLKHFDVERDPALMNIFAHAVDDFWQTLESGDLPPRLPDADDTRCRVCPWRLTCRGEHIDPAELARIMDEKHGKKLLKPLANDELDQALADRALIQSEIEALDSEDDEEPGALQLVTARIKELMGDTEAALVNERWRVYCAPNSWSGMDVDRLRREQPEIYKKYYITGRLTGRKRLRVYAVGSSSDAARE